MGKINKLLRLDRQIEGMEYRQKADFLTHLTLTSDRSGVTETLYDGKEVVVSLTTYGKRLLDVSVTIESLMQQTMRPNRILLWLEYGLEDELTESLKMQMKRGLEVRFCKDIRSYKKLIPSLKAFPEAIIITTDDDAVYYPDLVENLYRYYKKDPTSIHGMRVRRIPLDKKGHPVEYSKWINKVVYGDTSIMNIPIGVGGVLYPPNSLDPEVFNEEVFTSICPYADDIWFKAMSLRKGVKCRKAVSHIFTGEDYVSNLFVQDTGLFRYNTKGANDEQLKAVFDRYGLYEMLKEE